MITKVNLQEIKYFFKSTELHATPRVCCLQAIDSYDVDPPTKLLPLCGNNLLLSYPGLLINDIKDDGCPSWRDFVPYSQGGFSIWPLGCGVFFFL